MRLYVANDDNARALKQYGVLHKTLADELGVPPSAEASQLARGLQSGIATKAKTEPAPIASAKSVSTVAPPPSGIWALLMVDGGDNHLDIFKKHFTRHGGEQIDRPSFSTALFGRASDALDCAIAIQLALDKKTKTARDGMTPPRMALHVGEVASSGDLSTHGLRAMTDHAQAVVVSGHPGQLLCTEPMAAILLNNPDPQHAFPGPR